MEIKEYQAVIEAVLFASGEPVSVDRLAEILELDKPTVLKLAQSLQERLEQKTAGYACCGSTTSSKWPPSRNMEILSAR